MGNLDPDAGLFQGLHILVILDEIYKSTRHLKDPTQLFYDQKNNTIKYFVPAAHELDTYLTFQISQEGQLIGLNH